MAELPMEFKIQPQLLNSIWFSVGASASSEIKEMEEAEEDLIQEQEYYETGSFICLPSTPFGVLKDEGILDVVSVSNGQGSQSGEDEEEDNDEEIDPTDDNVDVDGVGSENEGQTVYGQETEDPVAFDSDSSQASPPGDVNQSDSDSEIEPQVIHQLGTPWRSDHVRLATNTTMRTMDMEPELEYLQTSRSRDGFSSSSDSGRDDEVQQHQDRRIQQQYSRFRASSDGAISSNFQFQSASTSGGGGGTTGTTRESSRLRAIAVAAGRLLNNTGFEASVIRRNLDEQLAAVATIEVSSGSEDSDL